MTGTGSLRRAGRGRRCAISALCAALATLLQGSAWAAQEIERVEVRPRDRAVAIALVSSDAGSLDLRCFSLADPPRLVFDIPDATLAPDQPSSLSVGACGISQVRVGQFQAEPPVVRLVFDLEKDAPRAWHAAPGDAAGETLIVVREKGPVHLGQPVVTAVGSTALLRLPGAAHLARRAATLGDPPRVYADLTDAVVAASYRRELADGPIREVRMAQQTPLPDDGDAGATERPVARVVAELQEAAPYTFFADGPDLVLAIGPESWALPLPPYQASGQLRGRRVVVDPGHGGKDIGAPAAFGPRSQPPYEKDFTLDIGLRLARLLRAEGAAVTMTREDDTYVTLYGRAAIANSLKADAFISIHCNSCASPNTLCGTSVYYDHAHSIAFAELVQQELIAGLGTQDKGVRNANFAVIRRTQGPGILVETAFINHEGDRARLANPNFRERAARAILQGLTRFLRESEEASSGGT